MRKITADELFDLLRYDTKGRFYSVLFERRTTRRDQTAQAGDLRKMLCRTAGTMTSYKQGVIADEERDAQDAQHGILTVWSMDSYMGMRNDGMAHENAAWAAWRRIDLMGLKECSLVEDDELPPTYRPFLHHLTNDYRLANMPRISRAESARR